MKITHLAELASGIKTEHVMLKAGHHIYMPESDGPFRCDHCEYYPQRDRCNNRIIFGYAERGERGLSKDMIVGNLVKVQPGSCSDEFERRTK
jgi:hypothetical protein